MDLILFPDVQYRGRFKIRRGFKAHSSVDEYILEIYSVRPKIFARIAFGYINYCSCKMTFFPYRVKLTSLAISECVVRNFKRQNNSPTRGSTRATKEHSTINKVLCGRGMF